MKNLKHQALLVLIYSAGLRVGEVVRLKTKDLNPSRGMIHIRGGKGQKDRYTLFSEIAMGIVEQYQA
ncbi:MAG: tyrosine-type recombinase/integrase, partial [Candidatus Latescibacteria bacterium]|nr:tyrosine-type recombinase/integrase [Candidatus Latescibacterota bacterium]